MRYTAIPDLRTEYHPGEELDCRIKQYDPEKSELRISVKEVHPHPFPQQPEPRNTERQPLPLEQRHAAYTDMLEHLTLLAKLCEDLNIPYSGGKRLSVSDAFRSATGDIQERIPVTRMGESHIYLAYCRDNKRTSEVLSRELVKETLNQQTNQYEKLANISYDRGDGAFRCENLVMDDVVDVRKCCRQAEELFELYKRCANRKQVETICANFLRSIEATKLSVTGYLYFVPRTFMEKVDVFEEFIGLLSGLNRKGTPLMVNSFYIIDDEKQRGKMTEEFYAAMKKEIAEYQERADYFIQSGCQSPAVMERWALKIQGLEERKRHK